MYFILVHTASGLVDALLYCDRLFCWAKIALHVELNMKHWNKFCNCSSRSPQLAVGARLQSLQCRPLGQLRPPELRPLSARFFHWQTSVWQRHRNNFCLWDHLFLKPEAQVLLKEKPRSEISQEVNGWRRWQWKHDSELERGIRRLLLNGFCNNSPCETSSSKRLVFLDTNWLW